MASGMMFPFGVGHDGGALLGEDSDHLRSLIVSGLMDDDSDHPFTDKAAINSVIFGLDDQIAEAFLMSKIKDLFASLEAQDLAQLQDSDKVNAVEFRRTAEGALSVVIRYIDLENQRANEILFDYSSSQVT